MPDRNISPLLPVVPAGSVLKKKKRSEKKSPVSDKKDREKENKPKKGIIDTYA
jgi:hypothetical protein